MDFFLEKCATKANKNDRKDDDSNKQLFLEDLDDDIMAVITTTTPLSAKDSMKLADRLIEVSSSDIEDAKGCSRKGWNRWRERIGYWRRSCCS